MLAFINISWVKLWVKKVPIPAATEKDKLYHIGALQTKHANPDFWVRPYFWKNIRQILIPTHFCLKSGHELVSLENSSNFELIPEVRSSSWYNVKQKLSGYGLILMVKFSSKTVKIMISKFKFRQNWMNFLVRRSCSWPGKLKFREIFLICFPDFSSKG